MCFQNRFSSSDHQWKYGTKVIFLSLPDCLSVHDDSHFSLLCSASYVQQLKVLEAVCIRTHKPDLCKQKEYVVALRLFS